jgi:hypothetical protein
MKMNDKVYDVLKWIALVALDAVGVFYNTISEIWGLPFGGQVLATCTAISLLIGSMVGIASVTYKKNKDNTKG